MNQTLLALLIAVAPAGLMAQLPEYVPSEGLEFWSDFDGDSTDESFQSVSSSIYGAQPTVNRNGEANQALAFDGQDDYILLYGNEGGTSFGENLTLAAWVRPASSILNGTHSRIFNSTEGVGGGPDRWLFTWSPPEHEEKMQFQVDPSGSNGPYGSTPLTVGEWSHVAMVFDQGQVSFYHNGVADGSATIANNSLAHVLAPIQVGSANGNSFFHGDIDDVGIWSEALSAEQIQALSDGGASQGDPSEEVASGCGLFSIQELAEQNLMLMDSILALSAALEECEGADALDGEEDDSNESWLCGDPVTYWDYDYATVLIGGQCWFAENLRAENYRNGDVIPVVEDDALWNSSTTGTRRAFQNNVANVLDMGYLYSWNAGNDDRGLCPSGWHVPSKTELAQIEMALGMSESDALSEGWHGASLNVSERMRSTEWGGSDELGINVIRAPWHTGTWHTDDAVNATQFLTSTLWDSANGLNSTSHCWTVVVTGYTQSNYHADSALPGIFSARCVQD